MNDMTDPPGTCHLVGCPQKGQHKPHGIGTGKWEDYATPETCLGYPEVVATGTGLLLARCSLKGPWSANPRLTIDPQIMATLVDDHKSGCPNRKPR